jgi:uncharacterized RDD family membrane protein YckC
MRASVLTIRTPEGIVFSQLLAGPVTRFLAWMIDLLCIVALLIALNLILGFLSIVSSNATFAVSALGYFIISIGYGMLLEWAWRGQTIGKRALRLRVVDVEGMRLQFNQIVTRNLLRAVDSLPAIYFVGGLTCWFNSRCQRLGDIAANTIVIRNPRFSEPDLDQLLAGKFNSLRQHPHLAARLRHRVTPAEAAAAVQALVRRDDFDAVARVELFADLAAHFRAKVEFPAEALEGVADEQYIRNVVDVVFRTGTEKRLVEGEHRTSDIEHRTSNAERRTPN